MDHLIMRQWQRLAEIQQVQLEMIQEAQARTPRPKVVVKKIKKKPKAKPKVADEAAGVEGRERKE